MMTKMMTQMIVLGVTVTEEQQQAALECMQRMKRFVASNVEKAMVTAGVPAKVTRGYTTDPVGMRAADRIIQRSRKEGLIDYRNGVWVWRDIGMVPAPKVTEVKPVVATEWREVLTRLLALPVAQEELRKLKLGIGAKTKNAAWLDAERLLQLGDDQ